MNQFKSNRSRRKCEWARRTTCECCLPYHRSWSNPPPSSLNGNRSETLKTQSRQRESPLKRYASNKLMWRRETVSVYGSERRTRKLNLINAENSPASVAIIASFPRRSLARSLDTAATAPGCSPRRVRTHVSAGRAGGGKTCGASRGRYRLPERGRFAVVDGVINFGGWWFGRTEICYGKSILSAFFYIFFFLEI